MRKLYLARPILYSERIRSPFSFMDVFGMDAGVVTGARIRAGAIGMTRSREIVRGIFASSRNSVVVVGECCGSGSAISNPKEPHELCGASEQRLQDARR